MAKTRLQEKYLSEAVKGMMDKFNYKNVMEIPKIEKVVINMGIGEAVANSKALDSAVADLTLIAGQRPVITKAKKSIAAFSHTPIKRATRLPLKKILRLSCKFSQKSPTKLPCEIELVQLPADSPQSAF